MLRELAWLLPALAAALGTFAILVWFPRVGQAWHQAAEWSVGPGIQLLAGLTYSAFGLMVGAAAGWLLRIVFTLIFGREALGSGDIYILAAAGAAGGWDIALLGLLLAVGIALAAYAISLLLKRTLTIPFGPWLALGFVAAVAEPACRVVRPAILRGHPLCVDPPGERLLARGRADVDRLGRRDRCGPPSPARPRTPRLMFN